MAYSGASQQKIKQVFQHQKKIIGIMNGSESRTSCKPLCQSLELLTLPLQYKLTLIKFLSHNLEIYLINCTVLGITMRNKLQLHKPTASLTIHRKGMCCMSVKILYELPEYIAKLVMVIRVKRFTSTLKKYLVNNFFHSLEEFINE
jgi:hypothetical protein